MITILNTSVLTAYGSYHYYETDQRHVEALIADQGFRSAIGHESTAQIISELLDIDCPVNRVMYKQPEGELAVIFKLNARPPEGKILSREEIEQIGYRWELIKRRA